MIPATAPAHRRTLAWVAALSLGLIFCFAVSPVQARNHGSGDVVAFGHSVTISQDQEVSGDLVVIGGSASVYGKVDGDAVVMGGELYIAPEGQVDGDTIGFGGGVVDERSGVHGRHRNTVEPSPPPDESAGPVTTEDTGTSGWLWFLSSAAVMTLLAFIFFPGRTRVTLDDLVQRPIVAAILGFFWPVIFLVVILALAITIIGIPLMPVACILVAVAYLLGRAAIAVFLGRRLFEVAKVVEPSPLATLVVGLLSITVFEAVVPLPLGIILEATLGTLAIGAVALGVVPKRFIPSTFPSAYAPRPPIFTPPSAPPPPSPPAVP